MPRKSAIHTPEEIPPVVSPSVQEGGLMVKDAPIDIASLLRIAAGNPTSVEVMERLMVIRRELRAEKAKEAYDQAMAAFQAECPPIEKTKEVKNKAGVVIYRFAPLESIVSQVKGLLEKYGFSYAASMKLLEGGVRVTIRTTHRAGHSEISEMEVPFGTQTAVMSQSQVVAAAQTFAKRYAFCNAFGILSQDQDTDAEKEEEKPKCSQNHAELPIQKVPDGRIYRKCKECFHFEWAIPNI